MTLYNLEMEERPILTGAMAKYPYQDWIEEKFSLMSNFEEPYQLSRVSNCGEYIYVPREVCPIGKKDIRVKGYPCGMKHRIKPRDDEQARLISELIEHLSHGRSFGFKAPTGVGKTVCSLAAIAEINRPTLVIVPKSDLLDQWIEAIHKFLLIPRSRIGVIQGDICDYKGKWIVVAMLQSVSKDGRYPAEMYRQFGLIVVDEYHRAASDELSTALALFPALLRLGVSATVKRKDGKSIVLEANIGPVLVESDKDPMKFKVLRYNSDWECPRYKTVEKGKTKLKRIPHTAGKCGHVLASVVKHSPTNRKIVFLTQAAYNKNRSIIVFSDRIKHLEELMQMASKAGIPRKDMAFYVGQREIDGKKKKMTKTDKEKALTKPVLFATFGMMKEGTDDPKRDTLILGTPRSDVEQIVGRIIRIHPDKKKPIVFDIDFQDSPVFRGYGRKRLDFYESKNAVVKHK